MLDLEPDHVGYESESDVDESDSEDDDIDTHPDSYRLYYRHIALWFDGYEMRGDDDCEWPPPAESLPTLAFPLLTRARLT